MSDINLCICTLLTACEQCMRPADVYCMECSNNYCNSCSSIRHAHKTRAHHNVRKLGDFDTSDEEITSSQTGTFVAMCICHVTLCV